MLIVDRTVVIVNAFGLVLEVIYMYIYWRYTKSRVSES